MGAQLSAPSLVLVTLDDRLGACTDPKDEGVVGGTLASIFSVVPALVSYKYDEVLKENGQRPLEGPEPSRWPHEPERAADGPA